VIALNYQGETQSEEMTLTGKLLDETSDTNIVDFSEDIQRFPIFGTPKNYSKVKISKDKCTNKFKEEQ
jgi:hypothetical protein